MIPLGDEVMKNTEIGTGKLELVRAQLIACFKENVGNILLACTNKLEKLEEIDDHRQKDRGYFDEYNKQLILHRKLILNI